MLPAVGIAQLNEHQLGRRRFAKPIEMMNVYVHFVHYDKEQVFPGHAVVGVDKQNKVRSDDNDTHLEEEENLDRLNSHWNEMMIHDDGLVEINLDHRNQMDDDDHLDYDENVGVWKEMRLNLNEV